MIGSKIALSMVLGALGLVFAASPARAGLDFTDTAQVGGVSTIPAAGGVDAVTVNGSLASVFSPSGGGSTIAMNNGFLNGGPGLVTFAANAVGADSDLRTIELDFSYTGAFNNVIGANYDAAAGQAQYGMVIEFGAISIPTGSVTLLGIGFSEIGSPGFSTYLINRAITTADAGNKIFIPIPSTGTNSVALADRDLVDAVRLQFIFTGLSTSVGINAVVNPEPGTLALFGLGLVGLVGVVRRRKKKGAVETAA